MGKKNQPTTFLKANESAEAKPLDITEGLHSKEFLSYFNEADKGFAILEGLYAQKIKILEEHPGNVLELSQDKKGKVSNEDNASQLKGLTAELKKPLTYSIDGKEQEPASIYNSMADKVKTLEAILDNHLLEKHSAEDNPLLKKLEEEKTKPEDFTDKEKEVVERYNMRCHLVLSLFIWKILSLKEPETIADKLSNLNELLKPLDKLGSVFLMGDKIKVKKLPILVRAALKVALKFIPGAPKEMDVLLPVCAIAPHVFNEDGTNISKGLLTFYNGISARYYQIHSDVSGMARERAVKFLEPSTATILSNLQAFDGSEGLPSGLEQVELSFGDLCDIRARTVQTSEGQFTTKGICLESAEGYHRLVKTSGEATLSFQASADEAKEEQTAPVSPPSIEEQPNEKEKSTTERVDTSSSEEEEQSTPVSSGNIVDSLQSERKKSLNLSDFQESNWRQRIEGLNPYKAFKKLQETVVELNLLSGQYKLAKTASRQSRVESGQDNKKKAENIMSNDISFIATQCNEIKEEMKNLQELKRQIKREVASIGMPTNTDPTHINYFKTRDEQNNGLDRLNEIETMLIEKKALYTETKATLDSTDKETTKFIKNLEDALQQIEIGLKRIPRKRRQLNIRLEAQDLKDKIYGTIPAEETAAESEGFDKEEEKSEEGNDSEEEEIASQASVKEEAKSGEDEDSDEEETEKVGIPSKEGLQAALIVIFTKLKGYEPLFTPTEKSRYNPGDRWKAQSFFFTKFVISAVSDIAHASERKTYNTLANKVSLFSSEEASYNSILDKIAAFLPEGLVTNTPTTPVKERLETIDKLSLQEIKGSIQAYYIVLKTLPEKTPNREAYEAIVESLSDLGTAMTKIDEEAKLVSAGSTASASNM